ncbi:MAG: aminopeptidase P family protein, partial [Curvibacter sp.]|nr:aminopeptidase P family protein [Curvibacter sp.]
VRSRAVGELQLLDYFEFPAPKGQMWFDRLHEVLKPSHRVGIESLCPLEVFRAVPGTAVTTDIVDQVREIKSTYEIGRLDYTSQWLSRGHARLLAAAKPGVATMALNSQIAGALVGEVLITNPRANVLACEAIAIATPPAFSHDPHLVPDLSCKLTEGGPHVTLVCGTANGYGAEVERTFFIGHVPEAAVRPFHAMLEARALGYELAIPGADMAEVDRRVNDLLKARGYGDYLLHRTGHSFGVTRHEAPFLAEGYSREIKPGMLFSIEPGIYLPGVGGFRFSDTVLVTRTGNQKLTHAPETLEDLTLQVGS